MYHLAVRNNKCSTNRKGKDYKVLPEGILDFFPKVVSDLFLEDNIDEFTQDSFGLRYDKITNRILIPVRNEKHELVGILSRINAKEFPNNVIKYNTFISYPPSMVLFGLDRNLKFIRREGYAVLAEAEKSVMKAFSKGIRNVLATGGSHLFEEQCELLIRLGITDVIVSFDSDKSFKGVINSVKGLKVKYPEIKFRVHKVLESPAVRDKSSVFDMAEWTRNEIENHILNYSFEI